MLTWFCWSCRAALAEPAARCPRCGGSAQPPPGTSWPERLVWAVAHPLTQRRMAALDALARIGDTGCWEPVRRLLDSPDPYLAAAALRTLAAIDPAAARPLVDHYRRHGSVLLRRAAEQASEVGTGGA